MNLQFFARKKRKTRRKTKTKKKRVVKSKKGGKKSSSKGGKKTSAPKATTKKKKEKKYVTETSYMNKDAYSNFYGEFILERQKKSDSSGNVYDNWVAEINQWDPKTGEPYSVNNTSKTHMHKEKLDKSGKFGFALANLGVFFGKHDIKEDLVNPVVAYKSDYEALTNYEEWRSDGSTDPDDTPHIIAKAGQEIIIDTANNKVTIDGKPADKYVSWLSTFPKLTGGVPQTLHFFPDPKNADVTIEYRPAIK